ncbi:MAG: hypothetical protein LBI32_00935 [Myroides odoratus]|jgi:hypothetical protein|nr:hypothetical protein [Myroides odoratus]
MVRLNIDVNKVNLFYKEIEEKIVGRIDNSVFLDANQKDGLKNVLETIIKTQPEDLLSINNEYLNEYFPNLIGEQYNNYLQSNKAERAQPHFTTIKQEYEEVIRIFDYKNIVSPYYYLADLLGVDACVYCNRTYVKTIGKTSDKVCRAEYDHWLNKSFYPLLALSFYNLVPSCPFCNKLKLDKIFSLDTHFHPYTMENKDVFKFSYLKKNLKENNVIVVNKENLDEKNKNLIAIFKLDKLYDAYSATELKELLDLRFKYNTNYIDDLINVYFKGKLSEKEIYRMIFGIERDPKDFSKRPFSKFKNDIIDELKKIK